jgi:hypothetical protein
MADVMIDGVPAQGYGGATPSGYGGYGVPQAGYGGMTPRGPGVPGIGMSADRA